MTKECVYCQTEFTPKRPHALYCSHSCSKKILYQKNKETGRYRDQQYRADLVRRYGITVEQYNEILVSQNFCCKICSKHITEQHKHKRLYVDHCHETGRVRGLLCSHCNTLLGMAKDNISVLENSILYLKENL